MKQSINISNTNNTTTTKISYLDGIKGLAVALVLVFHFSANGWSPILTIDYCKRRILKIWPLYPFALIFSFLNVFLLRALLNIDKGWPYTIHLNDSWMHITLREGFSVLWSIPIEKPFMAINIIKK